MMHVCLDHIIIHFNVNQNHTHLATIDRERERESVWSWVRPDTIESFERGRRWEAKQNISHAIHNL